MYALLQEQYTIVKIKVLLLAKLNWRFHFENEALWSQVLRNKYCSNRRLNSRNYEKLVCSRIWKGMKKGHEVFSKGTRWIPGRDSNLSLWFDNWSSLGPLRDLVQGPLSVEEASLKIKDVITPRVGIGLNYPSISQTMLSLIFKPFPLRLLRGVRIGLCGQQTPWQF